MSRRFFSRRDQIRKLCFRFGIGAVGRAGENGAVLSGPQLGTMAMTKLLPQIALLIAFVPFAGCDAVVMENRIGDTIDRGEALRLNGVWMTDQGPIHANYVVDGKLVFASLRWDEA